MSRSGLHTRDPYPELETFALAFPPNAHELSPRSPTRRAQPHRACVCCASPREIRAAATNVSKSGGRNELKFPGQRTGVADSDGISGARTRTWKKWGRSASWFPIGTVSVCTGGSSDGRLRVRAFVFMGCRALHSPSCSSPAYSNNLIASRGPSRCKHPHGAFSLEAWQGWLTMSFCTSSGSDHIPGGHLYRR